VSIETEAITAEAIEAAGHWGGQIIRLIRNRENAVFEMALPSGPAALRLHRMGYQNPDAIRSELWWTRGLAQAGVAVPAPQPALGSADLVTLSTGRLASVIDWVPGAPLGEAGVPFATDLPTILAQHRALGALVAQVHRATDALHLPGWFTRPKWDVGGLTGETPFWGRFWEHPALDAHEATILHAARTFLHDWLVARPGLDQGPIHADVLRENVLVDGGRLSLIDFDDAGIGYRLYDLGTVLSQNLYEPAYPAIRDALIGGYGTGRVAEVEVFTLARTLASVGWAAPRLPPGDPVHRRHIARAVMWARHTMSTHQV
jgi:Ser/Thr protein kinase RdoA (MazF antagonist)